MLYGNTITLWNYHELSGKWYPSVIDGVDLGVSHSSTATREGGSNANTVIVLIRTGSGKELRTTMGMKRYLTPKEYAKCDDPEGCYTFAPELDFFCEDEWDDLTPCAEDEEEEGLYQSMNDFYDGVHLIQSAEFFGLLPHFEIGGR